MAEGLLLGFWVLTTRSVPRFFSTHDKTAVCMRKVRAPFRARATIAEGGVSGGWGPLRMVFWSLLVTLFGAPARITGPLASIRLAVFAPLIWLTLAVSP